MDGYGTLGEAATAVLRRSPRSRVALAIVAAMAMSAPSAALSAAAGRLTGIGGVIVESKHPRVLAAWYRDVLRTTLQP